jgi:hypothetical protein
MTNADVEDVILGSKKAYGTTLSVYEAKVYLGARELLLKEPENPIALEVVEAYVRHIKTGERLTSFSEFVLPIPYTDEEISAHA